MIITRAPAPPLLSVVEGGASVVAAATTAGERVRLGAAAVTARRAWDT
jgi:hypothetical protein